MTESGHGTIARQPAQESYPLSYAQQALWLRGELFPGEPIYNVLRVLDLTGPLAEERLRRALQILVDRYDVLRARFTREGAGPVQSFFPAAVALPLADLSALPVEVRAAEARSRLREVLEAPFDLAAGPPFRFWLVSLAGERHLLLLAFHHLVIDGTSYRQLVHEVLTFYGGGTLPLPRLQFQDFVAWQRERVESGQLAASHRYWRERLGGTLPVLDLPLDRPRGAVPSHAGAAVSLPLGADFRDALKGLARESATTLFRTFCAAFKVLLHRLTGATDLIVGAPFAGRTHPLLKDQVGFFVTTPALRTDLGGDPPFAEALARVNETVAGAKRHQEYPFEKVLEELDPGRDLRRSPLYSVSVLERPVTPPQRAGDLLVGHWEHTLDVAINEILATEAETEDGLQVLLYYRRELFDRTTVERWAASFEVLLLGIVAHPRWAISELPLLRAAERVQILHEWNDTRSRTPFDRCFHDGLAARAAEAPDAVAALFAGQALTFRELDRRAGRLARHLRRLGVGPDVLVGLCLPRSLELLIALFGILKAGGAFLPMDPDYPEERLAYMLADSRVSLLVSRRRLAERLLPASPVRLVCLDEEREKIARQSAATPPGTVAPENLAYAMYTSGSTGQPKAVLVTHRGFCGVAAALLAACGFGPADRILQFSSLSFDAAVFEIAMALGARATLCLAPREDLLPGPALLRRLREWEVTVLVLPVAVLAAVPRAELPALRTVVTGGEACPAGLVETWGARHRFFNFYGPTETTICATCWPASAGRRVPPIGRPIANAQAYPLDRHLRPVAAGLAGELYLGGVGMARGYLHRPDLTAERFVPHPAGDEPGARLYRTGDLARWRADGQLEFVGRVDGQVKVRGFRIELGEIEAALAAEPGVREAVVIVREDEPGDRRLVAYVVEDAAGGSGSVDALRQALLRKLPEPLVPSAILRLPALPLTVNGKVDRQALPAPERARPAAPDLEAAHNWIEELLRGIWEEVLRLPRVGLAENFYELGGHSLLAIRVASRVHQALGVELPLHLLLERPTVAALAAEVERALQGDMAPPPILPEPGGGLPLSFAQQRLWFADRLTPGSPLYNIPLALRLSGHLSPRGVAALGAALAEIVRRHEVLRTVFRSPDEEPLAVVLPPLGLADLTAGALPQVDLSALAPPLRRATAARLLAAAAARPFDLAAGPLLRPFLIRHGEAEHELLVNVHHIAFDGWSLGLLATELGVLYRAFAAGHPSPLPELPLQYGDYARWQRRWLSGEVLEGLLAAWRERLAGSPSALDLPADRPRPAVMTHRGSGIVLTLPAERLQGLDRLSRQHRVTLFMTLAAGLAALLQRSTGQADLLLGTPVAHRGRTEIRQLLGFFVNTLVLRFDLSGDPDFSQLLGRVQAVALHAFAHQDLPFEKLVEALAPERDPSRTPFFQVLLTLQNNERARLDLGPGLVAAIAPLAVDAAKFDLSWTLEETAAGELTCRIQYSTDLFDGTTVRRLGGHFETLIAAAVAEPGRRLSELPLLAPAERQQLLEWKNRPVRQPARPVLHELFAAQAGRTPDAVAVAASGRQLTYAELDRRANRLARSLARRGVGPDVLVGLCAERSVELVVGLLGILKAGGAYLPLDPAQGTERLRFLLEDSGLTTVVTVAALAAHLPAAAVGGAPGPAILRLDADGPEIARESAVAPPVTVTPDHLAYVIYTSGSTGRPKGTLVPHRAVPGFCYDVDYVEYTRGQRFLQYASIAWDVLTLELWPSLIHGGRSVLMAERLLGGEELESAVSTHGITTLWMTSSQFNAVMDTHPAAFCGLAQLLVGGEALSVPHIRRALARFPGLRLLNGYGPVECTVFTACHPISPDLSPRQASIPIGRPIGDRRVAVLDRHLAPVPVGVVGELCVAGDSLARGYLGRPWLTAERFVPDPASDRPGGRLYRTGDLVRWYADGRLDFVGRVDDQVKIRGFRVEPGEIEAVLAEHPEVGQAVVLALPEPAGGKRLVAYVVPALRRSGLGETFAAYLGERLPPYMVPAAFVILAELPRNANGKLDRGALPLPTAAVRKAGAPYEPPRAGSEEQIAEIWRELLGLPRVGRGDNFFDLGGHSLLLVRLHGRLQEKLRIEFPLLDLFSHPNVRALALHLDSAGREAPEPVPESAAVSGHRNLVASRLGRLRAAAGSKS